MQLASLCSPNGIHEVKALGSPSEKSSLLTRNQLLAHSFNVVRKAVASPLWSLIMGTFRNVENLKEKRKGHVANLTVVYETNWNFNNMVADVCDIPFRKTSNSLFVIPQSICLILLVQQKSDLMRLNWWEIALLSLITSKCSRVTLILSVNNTQVKREMRMHACD